MIIICILVSIIATSIIISAAVKSNDRKRISTAEEIIFHEKVFTLIKKSISYVFLGVLALMMILPFYWMFNTSLKGWDELQISPPSYFPGKGDFPIVIKNFPDAISRMKAWVLIKNTLIVGVISTIGTLITTIMSAFAFTRIKFKGREVIFSIFLATMMIPGEMMVLTNYITVSRTAKQIFGISGIDSYWALIVPFLISVYYIYLLRQNFRQIPDELYYAAKVDGTSDFKYLLKVMIPIAMPTLITISILKLMGSWNAYAWPNLITNDPNMRLITNGLRGTAFTQGTAGDSRTHHGLQMAATTVVTVPLLLVFVFLRKYIMRGVSRSGIKG